MSPLPHSITYHMKMSSKRITWIFVTITVLGLTAGCSSDNEVSTVEAVPKSVEPTTTPFRITRTETPISTTAAREECAKPTIEVTRTEFSDSGYQTPLTTGTTWTLRSVTVRVTNTSANKIATTGVQVFVSDISSPGGKILAIPADTGRLDRPYRTIDPGKHFDFQSDATMGAIQSQESEPSVDARFYDWHFSDKGTDIKCNTMNPKFHN